MSAVACAKRMLDPKDYGDDPMDDAYQTAKALLEAVDLLKRCYQAGHREGWENGETNDEVFAGVNSFLYRVDPEGSKRAILMTDS